MHRPLLASFACTLLAACTQIPLEAHSNRGTPESLLDMSSEVVNVSVNDPAGADELAGWINQEAPSRADIFCVDSDASCRRAKDVLAQFNVPYAQTPDPRGSVTLYYERVQARDCENRYIDNTINPYNLNHPTFGCSVASNIVQSVTDRRQFINPALMDLPDGEKAVQNYREYQKLPPVESQNGLTGTIKGSEGKGLE